MSFKEKLFQNPFVKKLLDVLDNYKIHSLEGASILLVLKTYWNGLFKTDLGNRAAAISWRLFLSIFPFVVFLFLLIQQLPNFDIILSYLNSIYLENIFTEKVSDTIANYIVSQQENLQKEAHNTSFPVLLISILLFLIFSSNGIRSLIKGLGSNSSLAKKKRSKFQKFYTPILITILITLFMLLIILFLYYTEGVWRLIAGQETISLLDGKVFAVFKYFTFLFVLFSIVVLVYYWGSETQLTFKETLPGAFLTTILFVIIGFAFGYYIGNFAKYNLLYGSVGSIIIVMIGMNLNVILFLIGYELNLTLARLHLKKKT